MKYFAAIEDESFEISLIGEDRLSVNGEVFHFDVRRGTKPEHFSLILEGRSHQVWIEEGEKRTAGAPCPWRVHLHGFDYEVCVEDERSHRLRQFAGADTSSNEAGQVLAPMPGLVVKLLVQPGQKVEKGEGIVIVEAMKMENEIRAGVSGEVKEVRVSDRQAVEKGEILAVIG